MGIRSQYPRYLVSHEFLAYLGPLGTNQGFGDTLELAVKICTSPKRHFTTVFCVGTFNARLLHS
jgi:hypothetical protein